MGIRIDGASDIINASDGSLTIEGQSVNTSGMVTATGGLKIGTAATIHSTGQFNIGVAATIFANGNATFAGILTAASFSGIDLGAVTGATGDFSIADKIVHTGDTNTTIRFPSADTFTVETAGSERLRIKSNGFLGIGTDNPYSALTIKTTAEPALTGNLADHGILLHAPGATKNDVLAISASFINNNYEPRCAMGFISHPTADPIEGYAGEIGFYTRDAADGSAVQPGDEKVRINRVGRVGIGTTSPSNLLHTYKSTSDGIQFQSPSGQHYIYAIEANDNLANGTLAGELGIRGKNGVAISGNNGTACQVHINSNGLCLGGTGSANALDDYEEGSWTPVPDNLSNTPTYHNQVGIYTKIGNLVTVVGFLQFNATPTFNSEDNELRISGLPFTANGAGYANCVGNVTYQSLNWSGGTYNDYGADGNMVCGAVDSTKTVLKVNPGGNNEIRGTLRREAFVGGGIITWQMTYKTNS